MFDLNPRKMRIFTKGGRRIKKSITLKIESEINYNDRDFCYIFELYYVSS